MAHTFAPPSQPLATRISNFLAPLAEAFHVMIHNVSVERIAEKHREQNEPLRQQLLAFEALLTTTRKAVAEKKIHLAAVRPDLVEWVNYSRNDFYVQLRKLYVNAGFWHEVERIEKLAAKGGKYVAEVKDDNGNFTGTETISDTKGKALHNESNATVVEL